MTTALLFSERLGEATGINPHSISAIITQMRKIDLLPPTARGRYAKPLSIEDGAKIILALMLEGPASIGEQLPNIGSAKPAFMGTDYDAESKRLLNDIGLRQDATFLQLIEKLLTLGASGNLDEHFDPTKQNGVWQPTIELWVKYSHGMASLECDVKTDSGEPRKTVRLMFRANKIQRPGLCAQKSINGAVIAAAAKEFEADA